MIFEIIHRERLVDVFTYEADSREDAIRQYKKDVEDGSIDFSRMEMEDASDMICEEGHSVEAEEFSIY